MFVLWIRPANILFVLSLLACVSCGDVDPVSPPGSGSADENSDATTSPTEEAPPANLPFGYTAVDASACAGEARWSLGKVKNTNMHPGFACMECHASENEAPAFGFAGTVYKVLHDPDDCIGERDVEVVVMDANGVEFRDTTNPGGNFYVKARSFADAVTPLTAHIEVDGVEVASMEDPVPSGDCNSCHTPTGAHDAPGRIIIPE